MTADDPGLFVDLVEFRNGVPAVLVRSCNAPAIFPESLPPNRDQIAS